MILYTQKYIQNILFKNIQEFNNSLYMELLRDGSLTHHLEEISAKAFSDLNTLMSESTLHEFESWEIIREPLLYK